MQLGPAGAIFLAFAMIAAAAGVVASHALTPAPLLAADELRNDDRAETPTGAASLAHHRSQPVQARDARLR
jgi:hypothetical protein